MFGCAGNGKYRHEFLLQRAAYRLHRGADAQVVGQVFTEPVGMKDGKSGVHVFAASCAFMPTLRQLGHSGVAINVCIQDGALHYSLSRFFVARHSLYYTHEPDLGDRHAELENSDWVISLRCVSHCASSAMKWSLQPLAADGLIDHLFIAIAGLRNSFSALMGKVSQFVMLRVRFTTQRSGSL